MWTNSQQSGRRAGPARDARVPWAGLATPGWGHSEAAVPALPTCPCEPGRPARPRSSWPTCQHCSAAQASPEGSVASLPLRSSPRWPQRLVFLLTPLCPISQRPGPARSLRPHSRAALPRGSGKSVRGDLHLLGAPRGTRPRLPPSSLLQVVSLDCSPRLVCAGSPLPP